MGQDLKAEAAREERDDAWILEMLDESEALLHEDSSDPVVNRRSRRMLGLVEARIVQRRFR